MLVGIDDDDVYTMRISRRIAGRVDTPVVTDERGILFLEIDGLALPVLRDAMRDGSAPAMASWIADHGYHLVEW